MRTLLTAALVLGFLSPQPTQNLSPFELAMNMAERSLGEGNLRRARDEVERALERDSKSIAAWELRARVAGAADDRDEEVFALHRQLRLSIAQGMRSRDQQPLLDRLAELDPISTDSLSMNAYFLEKLLPIARRYEGENRPHAAIATFREVLALDPESEEARAAIERIASQPDPSLAAAAKPKDLFADISDEWIRKHDEKHDEWGKRAKQKTEHYTIQTNAGYKVLLQTAAAMDQMNAFYKVFFEYDGNSPRIDINVFKNREEYLKKGIGPPQEWSGGHFTGGAVETYLEDGGFAATQTTLFHEAAHQFVSLSTRAAGWLNEGLASFFEGCRMLPNGTVQMNLPATQRLFPLAQRMSVGWMKDEKDGIGEDPNQTPSTSPTFRIVLENKYKWGPPWYAPTWGVVYFLYNYQDPFDGRFIYRKTFREFINKSSKVGEGAIKTFEKIVLQQPAEPTKGTESTVALPETVEDLNEIWQEWILKLRNEYSGATPAERPWLRWARFAVTREEYDVAKEHFEKGFNANRNDIDLLIDFAKLLSEHFDNDDRASKLLLRSLQLMDRQESPDKLLQNEAEKLLGKWDSQRKTLAKVHEELEAALTSLVQRYLNADLHLMAMDLAWRASTEFGVDEVLPFYEEAVRRSGKSLFIWNLAYNEQNLDGWGTGSGAFRANEGTLDASFGNYQPSNFAYNILTLDAATTGDYSFEAEVLASPNSVSFAGLVFGRKSGTNFHALIHLPPTNKGQGLADSGFLDLASFAGGGSAPRIWRHMPLNDSARGSVSESWHKLRLDVTDSVVDVWVDDQLQVVHDFKSPDVVSGSVGLITGSGNSRFRNIRWLSRSEADPGAAIERRVRMEDFDLNSGESINGSWLGMTPPFPDVKQWVVGERKDWSEAGPVPQLLVLWSIAQNDRIAINDWLISLQDKNKDVGLEIVNVASFLDADRLESYLMRRAFPGAVALDDSEEPGFGDTFNDYSVEKFNLPRLLLLDIDGKVVWEGDPGLKSGQRWTPGFETYLDAPLEELISSRNLRKLSVWRKEWTSTAAPALHRGDLKPALAILKRSQMFSSKGDSDVFTAQGAFKALQNAVGSIDTVVASFERDSSEAAIEVLLEWAEQLDVEIPGRELKRLRKVQKAKSSRDWDALLKRLNSYPRDVRKLGQQGAREAVLEAIRSEEGAFPAMLLDDVEAGDPEQLEEILAGAENIPRLWLAQRYFNW